MTTSRSKPPTIDVPFDGIDFILTELNKKYGKIIPGYHDKLLSLYKGMVKRGFTYKEIKGRNNELIKVKFVNIPVKWYQWLKDEYEMPI